LGSINLGTFPSFYLVIKCDKDLIMHLQSMTVIERIDWNWHGQVF